MLADAELNPQEFAGGAAPAWTIASWCPFWFWLVSWFVLL